MEHFAKMLPKVDVTFNKYTCNYNMLIVRLKGSGVDEPDFKIELTLPEQEASQNDSANTSSSLDTSIQSYYKMSCGPNFQVTGACRGRKDGQQIAAQKMLRVLNFVTFI